ncbi:MAG: glycosyltransferase family 4 protein [Anaerolineae bacterium]|nr:glycosyltransferase family 4 protein [Anaerolineae bacterium]
MRICYTLTSYPPAIGGAQLHFHALARALAPAHDVQVISHWRDNRTDWLLGTTVLAPWNPRPYAIDGIPVSPLRLSIADRLLLSPLVAMYYPLKDAALPGIARVLERRLAPLCGQPDIIHNGRIGREGLSYASWRLARRLDVPFVLTPVHHPRWVGWFYRAYIRLYREADAVIALTQAEKQTLAALGVAEDRIHVTGMGPDLSPRYDAEAFRARHGITGPMVLFVGQKFAYKNYEALLAAAPTVWARWPDARFVFIGPRTRHSQRAFAGHSDPRIVELGAVGIEEKTSALAACDVFCMPSSQESFGGVFVEAWMMGKPVIGGDIPAVREVIADGVDGFLVPPAPATIADRILALLADTAMARRMGEAGRQKALTRFTWDKLAAKTLAVYEGLLK